jgi:hypothetical protein
MPLGPDRCNGPSGYMYSTIPPTTLKRAEGSIYDYISYYIHVKYFIFLCIHSNSFGILQQ